MEETSPRIRIKEEQGRTIIFIKPHNSILHAFFAILVLTAIFQLCIFIFSLPAGIIKHGFIITILAYGLAGISIIYKVIAVFEVFRSLSWTIAGGETIEINADNFIYKKKIAGIGPVVVIPRKDILSIEEIDYIREKDVIHMLQSEITKNGRSFRLKTASKTIKFGVYISMDDSDALDKLFKRKLF